MARYLFIHQNFPGQFPHIARALAERGDTVVAIGDDTRIKQRAALHPRIAVVGYPEPKGANAQTHHYLHQFEAHVRRGQAVFRVCQDLLGKGFRPDVVVAHPGWGETLFLKDAFPLARHIHYLEFFYRADGSDVNFDPEFPTTLDDRCRIRLKNSTQLTGLEYADAGISPTQWQKSQYPLVWQPRIRQLHDGIDTARACPDALATVKVGGLQLSRADEVITYVARNLEPYRGFHTLMRTIPLLLQQRPKAHIVVVGGNEVSYGRKPGGAATYGELYRAEWGSEVDTARVHFVGRLPYEQYLRVLQVSSLHIYLTYPFVLSWSLLEAMSAGCLVLGSDTAPVTEVIKDGDNGFLTDFFDAQKLALRAVDLLQNRTGLDSVRTHARNTVVEKYDLHSRCLPDMLDFISVK